MIEILVQELLVPVALALLAAAAAWVSRHGVRLIKAKAAETDNQLLSGALDLVGTAAATRVAELAQTAVEKLKAAREDGRLTPDEAQAALRAAVEATWQSIGRQARATLTAEAGSEAAAKTAFVAPAVEQMVAATRGQITATPPQDEGQASREVALARVRLGLTP